MLEGIEADKTAPEIEPLSPREREIATAFSEGETYQDIAARMERMRQSLRQAGLPG